MGWGGVYENRPFFYATITPFFLLKTSVGIVVNPRMGSTFFKFLCLFQIFQFFFFE